MRILLLSSALIFATAYGYTLKLMCDDVSTIYYDGVEQKNVKGTGNWYSLTTTTIPTSTRELKIKCANVHGGPNGIKAQIFDTSGTIITQTGTSWQCSTSSSGGYKPCTVENMHSDWKNKAGSASVIWTSSTSDVTVYTKYTLPGGHRRKLKANEASVEYDMDYWGSDIKNFQSSGLRDCYIKCRGERGCVSFTMRQSDNHCWLKSRHNGVYRRHKTGYVAANLVGGWW